MRSLVVLILTFIFMLAAVKSSFAAALLYWWFAIFRPQDWIWWDVSSLRLPLIAAVLFVPFALLRGFWPRIDNIIAFYIVTLCALSFYAYIMVGCEGAGPNGDAPQYLATLVLVILITERLINDQRALFYVVAVVGLSLGFHAGKAGIDYILAGGASAYGSLSMTGLFTGSNAFALGSGMLVFYIIFIYQQSRNPLSLHLFPEIIRARPRLMVFIRWGLLITIIGTVYNVIALFSRGASLATFVGFLTMAILHPKRIKIFAIGVPLAFGSLIFIPIPEGYKERISSAFVEKEELDDSAASRPHFWGVAKEIVKDHPFGVGPGCYPDFYDYYDPTLGKHGHKRSVHSSHFQILTEAGYLGLVVWGMLFLTAWMKQLKIRRVSISQSHNLANPKFYVDAAGMLACTQVVFVLGGAFYEVARNDIIWLSWVLTIALERLLYRELAISRTKGFEASRASQ